MELKEFAEYIEKESILYLPEEYQGKYPLKLRQEGTDYLLQFSDDKQYLFSMPGINVNKIYREENYKEALKKEITMYIEKYQQAIAREYENQKELSRLAEIFPENQIFYILIPAALYEKKWKNVYPATIKGDIAFLYMVLFEEEKDALKTCLIHGKLFKQWNVDLGTLHKAAIKNTPQILPYTVTKIREANEKSVYIISNQYALYGLGSIFYEDGALKEIASEQKQNLYIAALSTHEAVVFPENAFSAEEIQCLLSRYDIFSHTLYFYDYKMEELAIDALEKAELEARKKHGVLDYAENNRLKSEGRMKKEDGKNACDSRKAGTWQSDSGCPARK